MLLRKRKPARTKEAPRISYPRHRAFVRRWHCIGCGAWPVEAAHVRAGLPASVPAWARPGTSRKPHDGFTVPLCGECHHWQHAHSESAFEKKHGLNLLKAALTLARQSPCPEIREFVRGIQP